VPVDLEKGDIFSFPVLFIAGQRKFALSEVARKRLREYLENGGCLIADSVIGSSEFDLAFREEMRKLYPDRPLKALPVSHPIYNFVLDARQIELSPMAQQLLPDVKTPLLEAVEVDGSLTVVYSPLSMSAGWERLPRAYNKGYADADALKLGVNVFMYEISH
jgi:hypothetical protein